MIVSIENGRNVTIEHGEDGVIGMDRIDSRHFLDADVMYFVQKIRKQDAAWISVHERLCKDTSRMTVPDAPDCLDAADDIIKCLNALRTIRADILRLKTILNAMKEVFSVE
jgi:hypothetical protein